jgi:hypothetical protein
MARLRTGDRDTTCLLHHVFHIDLSVLKTKESFPEFMHHQNEIERFADDEFGVEG